MTKPLSGSSFRWVIAFAGAALALAGVELAVVHSAAFGQQPNILPLAVTLDVVLGVPLLYYCLVLRKLHLHKITLIAAFVVSLGLASLILPAGQRQYVDYGSKLLVFAEAGLLAFGISKLRTIVWHYQRLHVVRPDFINNLQQSLTAVFGANRINAVAVSEIALVRHSVFGWLGKAEKTKRQTTFTTYQESGQVALVIVLIAVCLIETLVAHLLLARWSATVAWAATGLSIYGVLFFVADLVALIKRPLVLEAGQLHIRIGLRWRTTINLHEIERVERISELPGKAPDTLNTTLLTSPNVLLHLNSPVTCFGIYGIRKETRRIALWIDNREQFIQQITAL